MTVSTADTSIKLGVDSPKKDAVIETLGMTACTAREVGIWAGSAIDVDLVQSIMGTVDVLTRFAKTDLQIRSDTAPIAETIYSAPLGATETGVTIDGVPGTGDVRLHVGTEIIINEHSHFLTRTVKRLKEAWLEAP
jgi:hypothetical protein